MASAKVLAEQEFVIERELNWYLEAIQKTDLAQTKFVAAVMAGHPQSVPRAELETLRVQFAGAVYGEQMSKTGYFRAYHKRYNKWPEPTAIPE